MKKYLMFVLLFVMAFLFGCSEKELEISGSENFDILTSINYPSDSYQNYDVDNNIVSLINSFSSKTVNYLFNSEENQIYSPVSLYMALAMLLEGTNEASYEELSGLLGSDIETIRLAMQKIYQTDYYENELGTLKMANSMWLKKGSELDETYLSNLEKYYYADLYGTLFDDEAKQNICNWINYHTNNLLKLTPSNYDIITPYTILILINTVYFDNKWSKSFDEKNTYNDLFNLSDGSSVNFDYMNHSVSSSYYRNDDYEIGYDYFENNNKIAYILPSSEMGIEGLINSNIIESIKNLMFRNVDLNISVPKVEYKQKYSLNDMVKNLGVSEIFNPGSLTMVKDYDDLFVSSIRQDAGIIFSEEGVKAAAATSITNENTSCGPSEIIYMRLNRPFMYIIYDSNNLPIFIGVVNNPE